MKKKILLIIAIVVVVISVSVALAIGAGAADAEPNLVIAAQDLTMKSSVNIRYYVGAQNVQNIADVTLLIWNSAPESYVKGTENYSVRWSGLSDVFSSGTYYYFDFSGVNAKMMTDDFYAVAYTKVGDNEYYSKPIKYSVLKYCYNTLGKLDKVATTNEKLKNLLNEMLDFGAAAQVYFDYKTDSLANTPFYRVKTVGGKLADGFTDGLYRPGKEVLIKADAPADGMEFTGWKNSAGDIVSTDAEYTVTVGNANETYTATYGELSSKGISYKLNSDGTAYVVDGLGTCSDEDIILPNSYLGKPVASIARGAFEGTAIKSIMIPGSVTVIEEGAFNNCTALTTIGVDSANAVYSANDGNLYNKAGTALVLYAPGKTATSFTTPAGVTEIADGAFRANASLTSITVGKDVSVIGERAFADSKITSVSVNASNAYFSANSGNLYNKSGTKLILYVTTSKTSFAIPSGVTEIGDFAFANHTELKTVTMPETLERVGIAAFKGCTSITTIATPNGLTELGEFAFADCTKLVEVVFGEDLLEIGAFAFDGCTAITDVYFNNFEYVWDEVAIGAGNNSLLSANMHFAEYEGEFDEIILESPLLGVID